MTQRSLTLWVWPLVLAIGGVLLLLHNFLLLDFDVLQLWPLLLVALGAQALLRGDLGLSWEAQNFGITRGSVQEAALRAESGELDLRVSALQRPGRLIAGQYTARSRPDLQMSGNSATLTMLRGKTWAFSLAGWDLALAADVPWDLLLSAYLGEIEADLRGVIVGQARLATGFGDVRLIAPDNPAGPIAVRSTFGNVTLTVPDNMEAAVSVVGGPLFGVRLEGIRWQPRGKGRYATPGYDQAIEPLEFTVGGTFGDLILS